MESLYYNLPDPPDWQPVFADLPRESGAVLVIRHSIRPPIDAGQFGIKLELNEEGIRSAREYGAVWEKRILRVSTSSSLRCVQTGEEIVKGAGLEHQTLHNPALGEPGAFIVDASMALSLFRNTGPLELVNRMLLGEHLPGHRSAAEGVGIMLKSFFSENPPLGSIHVEVTHDTVLAVLLYHLQGLRSITKREWPRMMEGGLFWCRDEQIYWRWRGETRFAEMPRI